MARPSSVIRGVRERVEGAKERAEEKRVRQRERQQRVRERFQEAASPVTERVEAARQEKQQAAEEARMLAGEIGVSRSRAQAIVERGNELIDQASESGSFDDLNLDIDLDGEDGGDPGLLTEFEADMGSQSGQVGMTNPADPVLGTDDIGGDLSDTDIDFSDIDEPGA